MRQESYLDHFSRHQLHQRDSRAESAGDKKSACQPRVKKRYKSNALTVSLMHVSLSDVIRRNGARICDGFRLNAVGRKIDSVGKEFPQCVTLQVTSLYLSQNDLTTLDGVENFRALKTLSVGGNLITDFKQISWLQQLTQLRNLNLVGNPICYFPNYRIRVIDHLKCLLILDSLEVRRAERDHAFQIACIDTSLRDRVLRNHFEISKFQMIQIKIKLHRDLFAFILGNSTSPFLQTQYMFDHIPNLHEAFAKQKMMVLVRIWQYENSGYYDCREQMEVQILQIIIQARRKLSEHPKVRAKELLRGLSKDFRSSEPLELQEPPNTGSDAKSEYSMPALPFELQNQFQSWYEAFTQMIYLQQDTIIKIQSACEKNLTDAFGYLSSVLATTPDGRQNLINKVAPMRPMNHFARAQDLIQDNQSDNAISKQDSERYSPLLSHMKNLPPQQPDPDPSNSIQLEGKADMRVSSYTMQNQRKKLLPSFIDRDSIRNRASTHIELKETSQSKGRSKKDHDTKEWDISNAQSTSGPLISRQEVKDYCECKTNTIDGPHSNIVEMDPSRLKCTPQSQYEAENAVCRLPATSPCYEPSGIREGDSRSVEKYEKASVEREAKYVSALMASEQREIDLKRQLFAAQKELQSHKEALSRDAMECEKIRVEVNERVQTFAYPKVTRRFFRRWVLFYSVTASIHRIRLRSARRLQHDMLIQWRNKCIQFSEIRRFLDRGKQRTLTDFFMGWNTASRVNVVARLTVKQSRRKKLMIQIMKSWRRFTMVQKISRKVAISAEYAQEEINTRKYFFIWKSASINHRQLFKLQYYQLKRQQIPVKRLTLTRWQLYLYQVARPRCQRVSEMREERNRQIESKFLTAWHHITNTQLHYARHIQKRVWKHWVQLHTAERSEKYNKRQEDRIRKKKAFIFWKKGVQAHVSSQRSIVLANRYSNHRKQRKIWRIWKCYTIAKRKYEQGSTKAWKHYFVKLLRSGWKVWAQTTRLHVRSKNQGKLDELQRQFRRFRRRIILSKMEASYLCFLSHFRRRNRTERMKKCYQAWKLLIAKSKQLLWHHKRLRNLDEDRLLFRIWFRWRQKRLQTITLAMQLSRARSEQLEAKESIDNREMEALATELGRWKAVAETRAKELRHLSERLDAKESETKMLQDEVQSRKHSSDQDTTIKKLYHEKEKNEYELQYQVKSLEREKEDLELEIDRLRVQLTKRHDSETQFYGEMEQMKRDIDSIRRERSRLIHDLQASKDETQLQITKMKTQLKKEQAERLDAANQLQEYEAEIASTRKEMRRQHEELEAETQKLARANSDLRHQLATAEAQRHEIEKLLSEKNEQILQLSSEFERLRPASSIEMIEESRWDRTSNQNCDVSLYESKGEPSFPESANLSLDPYCWRVHQDLQLLQDKLSERLAHKPYISGESADRRRPQGVKKSSRGSIPKNHHKESKTFMNATEWGIKVEEPRDSLQSLSPERKSKQNNIKAVENDILQIDSRQFVRTFDPTTSLETISAQLSTPMLPAELEITHINREIERMRKTERDSDINEEGMAGEIGFKGQEDNRPSHSPTTSHISTSQGHLDAADAEDWVKTQLEMMGDFILPRANVTKMIAQAGLKDGHRSHDQNLPVSMECLTRVGLDRVTLQRLQMPKELVDRLYRALYVYTKGFHSIISEIVRHIPPPLVTQMSSNIWLVFLLLLEQCDSGRYDMALSKLRQAFGEWREEREAFHQSEKFSAELRMQHVLVELQHVKEEKEKNCDHTKVLQTELERHSKLIQEGQTQQFISLESIRRLELEVRLREEEIDHLTKDLDDAKRDFQVAHSERLHVMTEKIANVEENQTLKAKLESSQEEKLELSKRLKEAILLNDTRVMELENLKQSISEIAKEKDCRVQENFQLSQQQMDAQKANLALTQEKKSLEREVSNWQQQHENDVLRLEAVKEHYQVAITQNAAHTEMIAALFSQINDAKLEAKIMETKNQMLAQEIKNAEMRPQDKLQFEILLNEKSQSQREIERLQESHQADQDTIQNLQHLMEGLEKDYQHLKGMFSASQQAFVRSERKCEQIRQECTLIEKRLQDSDKALSVLSEHHVLAEEKAKDQITSLQEEVRNLLIKLHQGRMENEKQSITTAQAIQNARQLRDEIESWDLKYIKLTQVVEELKDDKEELCHAHFEMESQVANLKALFASFLHSVKQLLKLVKYDKFPADEALREIIHLAKNNLATIVHVDGLLEEEDELVEFHEEMHSASTEVKFEVDQNSPHVAADTLDRKADFGSLSLEKRQSSLMERCVYIMSRYRKSKLETQVLQLTEESKTDKDTISMQEKRIQTQVEQLTSLIKVDEEQQFLLSCAQRDKDLLSRSLELLKEELREEKHQHGLVKDEAHDLRLELYLTVDKCARLKSLYRHTRQCWDRQVAQMEDGFSSAREIAEIARLMRSLRRTIAVEAIVSSSDAWTATTTTRDVEIGRSRISKTVLKSNNFMTEPSRGINHAPLWQSPPRVTDVTTLLLPKAGDFDTPVLTPNKLNSYQASTNVPIAAGRPLARRRDPSPRQQQRIALMYKQMKNVSFEEREVDDDSLDSEDEEDFLPAVQTSKHTNSVPQANNQRSKSSQHAFVNTAIEMIRPFDSQEIERIRKLECIGHKTNLAAKSLSIDSDESMLVSPFKQSSSNKAQEVRHGEQTQSVAFVPAILYPLLPR